VKAFAIAMTIHALPRYFGMENTAADSRPSLFCDRADVETTKESSRAHLSDWVSPLRIAPTAAQHTTLIIHIQSHGRRSLAAGL